MAHGNSAEWPTFPAGYTAFLHTCPCCAEYLTYDRHARRLETLTQWIDRYVGERVVVTLPTSSPSSSTSYDVVDAELL